MKDSNIFNSKLFFNNNDSLPKKSIIKTDNSKLYIKGLKYFYGIDCSINYKEAYEIFDKINKESKHKNNDILILLGIMHEKGLYVQQFYKKAVECYKKAAKNGSAKAYYQLAQLAEKGILDEADNNNSYDDVAFDYYTKSANLGYSDAFAKIGLIFEQGLLNSEINLEEAFKNFEKSINIDNNPIGLNGEGNAYYNGIVVPQNYEKAAELYKLAIKGGNIDALNNLGICFEYGKGVEQNNDKALELYKKGKEQNHRDATVNYAILKIKAGIKNNNYSCFSECFRILENCILVNEKNPEIYFFLGLMYEIGIDLFEDGNIIKNSYLAFLNYKKAAELDYPKACTKLGICLLNGINGVVPSNIKASITMLEKAVEKGDPGAKKYLEIIKNKCNE